MPNMDDIWLPIMYSAMDTRSSANDKESLEPEESLEDMWRRFFKSKQEGKTIPDLTITGAISLSEQSCEKSEPITKRKETLSACIWFV